MNSVAQVASSIQQFVDRTGFRPALSSVLRTLLGLMFRHNTGIG